MAISPSLPPHLLLPRQPHPPTCVHRYTIIPCVMSLCPGVVVGMGYPVPGITGIILKSMCVSPRVCACVIFRDFPEVHVCVCLLVCAAVVYRISRFFWILYFKPKWLTSISLCLIFGICDKMRNRKFETKTYIKWHSINQQHNVCFSMVIAPPPIKQHTEELCGHTKPHSKTKHT